MNEHVEYRAAAYNKQEISLKKIYDVDYMEASCNICIYSVLSVYKLLFKNA